MFYGELKYFYKVYKDINQKFNDSEKLLKFLYIIDTEDSL
jgi:hypothetical protein